MRRVFFCLDDATGLLHRQMDEQAMGGLSMLSDLWVMGRGKDIANVGVGHNLSNISTTISRNTGIKIVLPVSGEERRVLETNLDLETSEQVRYISAMPRGQFVVLNPSRWKRPLLCAFEDLPLPPATSEQRRASKQHFLSRVQVECAVPVPVVSEVVSAPRSVPQAVTESTKAHSKSLSNSNDIRLLVILSTPIPPTLTVAYRKAGLPAGSANNCRRHLENEGFIALHRFAVARRGAPIILTEVLERGWQRLESHGISGRPVMPTHGGWEHNLAGRLLEARAKQRKNGIEFEYHLQVADGSDVRIDVRERSAEGLSIFYQIGLSDPSREANALQRAWGVHCVREGRIVLVTRDKAFFRKVTELLRAAGAGELVARLEHCLLGSLYEEVVA